MSQSIPSDDGTTAAGADPDETLAPSDLQPETQGEDPVVAELGEDGEGDLAPEDL